MTAPLQLRTPVQTGALCSLCSPALALQSDPVLRVRVTHPESTLTVSTASNRAEVPLKACVTHFMPNDTYEDKDLYIARCFLQDVYGHGYHRLQNSSEPGEGVRLVSSAA